MLLQRLNRRFDFWSVDDYSIKMDSVSADLPTPSSASVSPPLPEPTNRSRHSRKRLVMLLLIFFGLVISSVVGFLYLESQDRVQKRLLLNAQEWKNKFTIPSVQPVYFAPSPLTNVKLTSPSASSSPTLTPEATTLTDLPPLYAELNWQTVSPQNSRFKDYDMIYASSNIKELDVTIKYNQLSGQEWYAEKISPESDPPVKLSQRFTKYYDSEFTKRGWSFRIELPQSNLSAPAGGYMLGDVMGYIGIKDSSLRLFMFEDFREEAEQCPCTSHYWVYVSEVTSLEKILD